MLRSPSLDSRHILGAAKVVLVLRFCEPGTPTRRLARFAATGFGTVILVFHVPRIGAEERPAKQTVVVLWVGHDSPPCGESCATIQICETQYGAGRDGGKTKNEEDRTARKKTQRDLQIKNVEENPSRKYNTFKPPSSSDFQNAHDTAPRIGLTTASGCTVAQYTAHSVINAARLANCEPRW